MAHMPKGRLFSERCTHSLERCAQELPPLQASSHNPQVIRACHKPAAELAQAAQEVAHV